MNRLIRVCFASILLFIVIDEVIAAHSQAEFDGKCAELVKNIDAARNQIKGFMNDKANPMDVKTKGIISKVDKHLSTLKDKKVALAKDCGKKFAANKKGSEEEAKIANTCWDGVMDLLKQFQKDMEAVMAEAKNHSG